MPATVVDFVLGMNAKLYIGDPLADAVVVATSLTEASNVKDVTVSMSAGEADISTRANSGWRATAPTLRECEVSFTMVWKSTDASFTKVKAAFLASTTIGLAALTGPQTGSSSAVAGILGNFSVTKFDRKEGLEEAITVDVTCKLAKFAAWLEIAGS